MRRSNQPLQPTGAVLSLSLSRYGEHAGEEMKLLADDVQSVVIPGTGHRIAAEH